MGSKPFANPSTRRDTVRILSRRAENTHGVYGEGDTGGGVRGELILVGLELPDLVADLGGPFILFLVDRFLQLLVQLLEA